MRKSCAKPVYIAGKNRGVAHILYSSIHCPFAIEMTLPHQNPQRPQALPPAFPTAILTNFDLLVGRLSPFYTAPITNTTKYINK